ncbi:MAG TPA: alcohol dehydrogenase catalytic domain-containing protein [Bryobacteraceae bacterium]|nr:alcohol dehydrogenase catalytic domain-containing protein [Bryobacteraceae bacterium]
MRAAGLDYDLHQLALRDLPEPPAVAGDRVLLRIQEVGVCGTDRELASFREDFGQPPEGERFLTLGHEALGQVLETAPHVSSLERGDWVVPMVRRPCRPPCPACARGRRDLCITSRFVERGIVGLHGYYCEFAVDSETDLVRVPAALAGVAVLIEPLSVVEKAVETALRIHEWEPETALVLGAGPIGMLAALALQLRGLAVSLHSLEPPDHPRVRLLERAGVRYLTSLAGIAADIVIEATGSAAAAFAGFRTLAPLGVYGLLGSHNATGEVPFLDMLRHNQAVFGSVNASPRAFAFAVDDLGRMPHEVLAAMIRRCGFDRLGDTLTAPPGDAAKIVHVIRD